MRETTVKKGGDGSIGFYAQSRVSRLLRLDNKFLGMGGWVVKGRGGGRRTMLRSYLTDFSLFLFCVRGLALG
jgi:hypothetical protein